MRRFPRILILLGIIGALAVLSSLMVSKLEERDTFCIACHTLPEVAYRQRALLAAEGTDLALDLGSRHYQHEAGVFRCIDCHRGADTLPHRLITQGLALRDTLIWISGSADPALGKGVAAVPMLINTACLRCHQETLLRLGFENHFHAYLPQAHALLQAGAEAILPSATSPDDTPPARSDALDTTISCTECHKAHVQIPGAELQGYLDLVNDVYPACEMCHAESGRGPRQLSGGGN